MSVANLTDMSILITDTTLQNRIVMALTQFCWNVVQNEAISASSLSQHVARKNFAATILNSPTNYKQQFVNIVGSNQTVANDATAGGTLVGMTAAQIAAAAALCTDTDINNAIAAAFNGMIPGI